MSKMLATSAVSDHEMCSEIFAPVRVHRYSRGMIQRCPALARYLWRVYALDGWDFDEIYVLLYHQENSVWIKYKTMRGNEEVRVVCTPTNVGIERAIELLDIIDQSVRKGEGCE